MSEFQVNQGYYFTAYPDVFQAWASGDIPSAEFHYNNFGWAELRDPNEHFDTSFYLLQNPDVAAAVQAGDFASPLQHFMLFGAAEGRAPNEPAGAAIAAFDEDAYLAANTDVADAIAAGDFENGLQHWQLYGRFEDRPGAPDISTPGDTITLTTGTDTEVGGNNDDVFQADVQGTALLPLQTLNSTDSIDGGGGHNTLNAQLVDPYVVPANIANIQEINLAGAPGLPPYILPFASTLDLVNQTDGSLETLGFRALMNNVNVVNIQSDLSTINVQDSNAEIFVELIHDTLTGDADVLALNLRNSAVGLEIDHYNGLAADETYETVNITSEGPSGNEIWLGGDGVTAETINVSGSAHLYIEGDALGFEHLRTFDASELTGDLWAEFGGAAEDEDGNLLDVSITGSQGDNVLDIDGPTSGNLSIETFDGDDTVWIDDHTGNIVAALGNGNNYLDAEIVTDGTIEVTAGDGDDWVELDLGFFGEDGKGEGVTLDLGDGANTLSVVAGSFTPGEDISFANSSITGVRTLNVVPAFAVGATGGSVDLAGLNDLEAIVFEDNATINGAAVIDNAPADELSLTFEGDLTIAAAGTLELEQTTALTITVEGDANIQGGLLLEDTESITLNVGSEAYNNAQFNINGTGHIVANDLETLTVNLLNDADFFGPVTAASEVISLETVTVTSDDDGSTFTMVFSEVATPSLETINLGGFSGSATITIDLDDGDVAATTFNPITITVGSGDLTYDADSGLPADVSPRETFIFTEDFGNVSLTAFNNADDASGDILDLTAFDISSYAAIDVAVDGGDWVISSDAFDGDITLVGAVGWGENAGDFLVTNVII